VWEYVFYVDFEGHASEPRVQRALETLREECIFLKVLGSYPRARRPMEA
jgi:chorismate mutase/prephenate dehydratase